MDDSLNNPGEQDPDVLDLLAKAGPPPEEATQALLFSPRRQEVLRSFKKWNEHWRANLDNSYYFRRDVADEVFDFRGVKCSIVKNAQWLEAIDTRNWSKHELYGYNGYALFQEVPYLFDGMTGSREEEEAFAREIIAYGGIDLTHLDDHGWLCSFITGHEWGRDNQGRSNRVWMKEQIVSMVMSVKKQSTRLKLGELRLQLGEET
jgi:hypothetical protein